MARRLDPSSLTALLDGRTGLAILTGASIVAGAVSVHGTRYLSAAQLWAYHLAAIFPTHPGEVLFLPGASPLSAIAYSPVAALGLGPFAYAHVVVVAMAVPLVAEIARVRGVPSPNLAALFLAASPTFLAAGPAGVAGADGALLVALGLYLYDVQEKPLAAGAVLGLLGLLRPELVIVGIGIAIFRRSATTGALAVTLPTVYFATGFFFAGDISWLSDAMLTPSVAGPPAAANASGAFAEVVVALVAVCPALGLMGFLPAGVASPSEHKDVVVATVFSATVLAAGAFDFGSIGLGPERLLPALPLLCPMLSRAVPRISVREGGEGGVLLLALTLPLSGIVDELDSGLMLVGIVAVWATLVAVARVAPQSTLPLIVAASVVGGLGLTPTSRLWVESQVPGLEEALAHLDSEPALVEGRNLVTDTPLVAFEMGEPASEVHFLWRGRLAAPLGVSEETKDEHAWVLEDHPFGAPIFDASPATLEIGDVLIVRDYALFRVYDASPSMVLVRPGSTNIFERHRTRRGRR